MSLLKNIIILINLGIYFKKNLLLDSIQENNLSEIMFKCIKEQILHWNFTLQLEFQSLEKDAFNKIHHTQIFSHPENNSTRWQKLTLFIQQSLGYWWTRKSWSSQQLWQRIFFKYHFQNSLIMITSNFILKTTFIRTTGNNFDHVKS